MTASSAVRRAGKLAFALGLTWYVLSRSGTSEVFATAFRADWRWLAAAVGLVAVDRTVMAWRWMALLDDGAGPLPRRRELLRIFFVSTFLGTFIPTGVGADAVRAWSLRREHVGGARALASVLMDRLLGVVALMGLATGGLWATRGLLPDRILFAAVATAAGGSVAAVALIYSRRLESLLHRAASMLPAIAAGKVSQLLRALRAYSARHATVTVVLIASLAVNVLRVIQSWLLGNALGIEAPLWSYFAFTPLIMLLMQVPISMYGLGTTQLGFWWLFARIGVPEADAVALSVLFLSLGLIGNLPGGLIYVFSGRSQPPSARTAI